MLSLLAGVGRREAAQLLAARAAGPTAACAWRQGVWASPSLARGMHGTPGKKGSGHGKVKRRGSLAWLQKKKDELGDEDGEDYPSGGDGDKESFQERQQRLMDSGVIGNMERHPDSPPMPKMDHEEAMADVQELFRQVVTFDTSNPDPRKSRDTMGLVFRNVDEAKRLMEKARAAYPPKTPEQEANPASAVPAEVYSKMIRLLTLAWNLRGAMRVLEEMRETAGLKPSVEAYGALVCAWERNLEVEMANKMRKLCFDDHPGVDVDEAMPRELEQALEDLHSEFIDKYGVPERNLTPEEYLEQQRQQQ